MHFGNVNVESQGDQHIFEVEVYLGDLDEQAVQVELYGDGFGDTDPVRQKMRAIHQLPGVTGGHVYGLAVSSARPPTDYTARVMPCYDGLSIPLEEARILWQR